MSRLLLITAARDEAAHLRRTAGALAAQTSPPDLWLIVDDGSADETPQIAEEVAASLPFARWLRLPRQIDPRHRDGLAIAAEARAFNMGLKTVELSLFTHIGKLDADIELPPDYCERLLRRFEVNSRLGVSGGVLLEPGRRGWHRTVVPDEHVRGALKVYSVACFEAIGGIQERLGWDTIDETYARMRGYEAHSIPDLTARHHRPVATAQGALRGRARLGRCAYVLRQPPWWVLLRSLKAAGARPRILAGGAFLYGYLRAAIQRVDRVEDDRFRRQVEGELKDRVARASSSFFRSFLSQDT